MRMIRREREREREQREGYTYCGEPIEGSPSKRSLLKLKNKLDDEAKDGDNVAS